MSDSVEARAPDADNASAADLSRAYGALFHQQGWESEADRGAEAGAVPAGDATPATPPSLLRILEALLFVGGSPLTAERAAATIRGLTPEQFTQAVDVLNRAYRRQGLHDPVARQRQRPDPARAFPPAGGTPLWPGPRRPAFCGGH